MLIFIKESYRIFFLFFFLQAEDGIRDGRVTEVQTCALPILRTKRGPLGCEGKSIAAGASNRDCFYKTHAASDLVPARCRALQPSGRCFVRRVRAVSVSRSEERRVGGDGSSSWWWPASRHKGT